MKVLVIDDNPDFLRLFKLYAEDISNIEFIYAESGEDGLNLLSDDRNQEISVIVSDIRMPKMSGVELLNIAKKNYPNITVILITGLEINYLSNYEIDLDLMDVVSKDIGINGIISKIEKIIQLKA